MSEMVTENNMRQEIFVSDIGESESLIETLSTKPFDSNGPTEQSSTQNSEPSKISLIQGFDGMEIADENKTTNVKENNSLKDLYQRERDEKIEARIKELTENFLNDEYDAIGLIPSSNSELKEYLEENISVDEDEEEFIKNKDLRDKTSMHYDCNEEEEISKHSSNAEESAEKVIEDFLNDSDVVNAQEEVQNAKQIFRQQPVISDESTKNDQVLEMLEQVAERLKSEDLTPSCSSSSSCASSSIYSDDDNDFSSGHSTECVMNKEINDNAKENEYQKPNELNSIPEISEPKKALQVATTENVVDSRTKDTNNNYLSPSKLSFPDILQMWEKKEGRALFPEENHSTSAILECLSDQKFKRNFENSTNYHQRKHAPLAKKESNDQDKENVTEMEQEEQDPTALIAIAPEANDISMLSTEIDPEIAIRKIKPDADIIVATEFVDDQPACADYELDCDSEESSTTSFEEEELHVPFSKSVEPLKSDATTSTSSPGNSPNQPQQRSKFGRIFGSGRKSISNGFSTPVPSTPINKQKASVMPSPAITTPPIMPRPNHELVLASGTISSRVTFRSILTKKWHDQQFWIRYGPTCIKLFRNHEDYYNWMHNPYLAKKERALLLKFSVDFYEEMTTKQKKTTGAVRGYKMTNIKGKRYERNGPMLYNFKLEKWTDLGQSLIAAFASAEKREIIEIRLAIQQCLEKCPEKGLRSIDDLLVRR